MGRDKAMLELAGCPLIEIALGKLRAPHLSRAPRIAGSRPDLAKYAALVEDIHPGCGPLGGIEAALASSSRPLNLFLAVDVPFLPARFLTWMLERAFVTGAWATFPRVNGRAQPLCAIYHQSLLPRISQSLAAGDYKVLACVTALQERSSMARLIDGFDIELIAAGRPELHDFSPVPLHRWFENLNSPADLAALQALGKPQCFH
jgi:molybdopterin-guanine dinucleotide biosynthesis protein A